jgi:hypothetical protein
MPFLNKHSVSFGDVFSGVAPKLHPKKKAAWIPNSVATLAVVFG